MNAHRLPLMALALFTLPMWGATGTAQQILVVGPGQPMTTIPPAIAAAAPGDTILVLAGTYSQALDIDKGVHLVGQGAKLNVSALPSTPWITVHDIPIGQTFTMIGFDTTSTSTPAPTATIRVRDCAGPVAIRDLQSTDGRRWGFSSINNGQLHVAGSFLYGMTCINSTVVLEDCLMEPASGRAMSLSLGSTTIVGCTVPGGNSILGGAGVEIDGGSLVATQSVIRGSTRGLSAGGYPAILATNTPSLTIDPSTQLQPSGTAPPISGTVAMTTPDLASVRASTNGSVLTIRNHGPAGGVFVTAVALAAARTTTAIGDCWMDLGTLTPFYYDFYDSVTRGHVAAIPHPQLPPGIVFAVQSAHFPVDVPTLGIPSLFTTP